MYTVKLTKLTSKIHKLFLKLFLNFKRKAELHSEKCFPILSIRFNCFGSTMSLSR